MPMVMKSWLRVPAGPPIDPGRQEVRYVGMIMVFKPTTTPSKRRESSCVETERLSAPMKAARMVA